MKILCKDQAEYDELMATSRYLHDFTVEGKDGHHSLNGDIILVGFLQHIHLEKEDFPKKELFVDIDDSVQDSMFDEKRMITKENDLDDTSMWMSMGIDNDDIQIPDEVDDEMEDGERVVGYFKNMYLEQTFFTKFGCHTTEGCRNYIYRSENDYVKEEVSKIDPTDLEKYEKHFIQAFLWN
jgi:hypothetical protein